MPAFPRFAALKRIALLSLAAVGGAVGAAPPQPWPDLIVTAPVSAGWLIYGEAVGRFADDSRSSQAETRLQLGHAVSRNVVGWIGWVHFENYVPHAVNTHENQVAEQVSWSIGALGPFRVSTRTRLEQRFIQHVPDTSWRWRQQLRLALPLGGRRSPSAVFWTEPFIALNHTSGQWHRLDQLRTFAGVTVPVTKRIDLEFGYLNQRIYRPTSTIVNDAFPLILTIRL